MLVSAIKENKIGVEEKEYRRRYNFIKYNEQGRLECHIEVSYLKEERFKQRE